MTSYEDVSQVIGLNTWSGHYCISEELPSAIWHGTAVGLDNDSNDSKNWRRFGAHSAHSFLLEACLIWWSRPQHVTRDFRFNPHGLSK